MDGQTSESPGRRWLAAGFAAFALLGMFVMCYLHAFEITSQSKYHRDLTQSPHWAAYHGDAFPADDLLRRYGAYNESPLQNAIYWVGTLVVDLVVLNKLVGIVIFGLTSGLFFLLVTRMSGWRAGVLAGLLFMIFPRGSYEIAGGFSKAWTIGLVLLAAYVVETRRWKLLPWSMPFAALAYPVSPVLMGAIVAVGLVLEFFNDRPESYRGLKFLVIGSALALLPLFYKYLTPPDFIGDMISPDRMQELYDTGASTERPLPLWEEVWYYVDHPFFYIVTLALILTLLVDGRLTWKRSWTAMLIGSAAFYLVAWALVPRLYLPDRYTRYTMAVFLVLWHAVHWDRRLAFATRTRSWCFGVVAVVALTAFMFRDTFKPCDGDKKLGRWEDRGQYAAVSAKIAELPGPVFLGGHPVDTACVMLQSRRPVLTIHRMFHHWFDTYRETIDTRNRDILRAYYATDVAEVNRLADIYGVTHFLVYKPAYNEKTLKSGNLYRQEYRSYTRSLTEKSRNFVLQLPPWSAVAYEGPVYRLVRLPIVPYRSRYVPGNPRANALRQRQR